MKQDKIVEYAVSCVEEWENGMSSHFGLFNEWASSNRMIDIRSEKRPTGVAKELSAETPRAVNALASSITRMQTLSDPYFELRSDGADEETLYHMEQEYQKQLLSLEFKRKLAKGNRGMCLFGTQVWEEPYIKPPQNSYLPSYYPQPSGTDFVPKSLLQFAFRKSVYDINLSDFVATIDRMNSQYLRILCGQNPGVWDLAAVEEAIEDKETAGSSSFSNSSIETRRSGAGYNNQSETVNEVMLWHGRLDLTDKEIALQVEQIWQEFGRTDDPKNCDFTVGIVNRKKRVRFHPTPYCSWKHLYKVGHYIEVELEPYSYGVGRYGHRLQKNLNRILSLVNDVETFSLFNMFLFGAGAEFNADALSVFPWSGIPVRDVNQVKELRPQIEGIVNGLKLMEEVKKDFRGVTHATDTLQAVLTGATATESSLAQSEAIRAVSLIAEINADAVIRPHLITMHVNHVDQNPYDGNFVRHVNFIPKTTTDKDFRPEHLKKLLETYTAVTTIRANNPIDFDPMVILKYILRANGINPREASRPRPQLDRMLDIMNRLNSRGQGGVANEVEGELSGAGMPDGNIQGVPAAIPSPVSGMMQ